MRPPADVPPVCPGSSAVLPAEPPAPCGLPSAVLVATSEAACRGRDRLLCSTSSDLRSGRPAQSSPSTTYHQASHDTNVVEYKLGLKQEYATGTQPELDMMMIELSCSRLEQGHGMTLKHITLSNH